MKARLVRIGNPRGVRLPKPLILEVGLSEDVELRVQQGAIVVARAALPRSGWADAAKRLRMRGEDTLLNPPTPTRFDETEWTW
jgi:antitoxin MazE